MTDSKTGKPGTSPKDSVFTDIASFFTSVRTTIAILGLLAVASILGTVLPQHVDPEQLRQTASPFAYRLILILDLNNVYQSWWFVLLLLLLTGNLLGCLLQRLPKIPGEWKGAAEKSTIRFTLSDARPVDEIGSMVVDAVNGVLGSTSKTVQLEGERSLVWVKQRIFLLAFPLIHVSIIIVLVGGLLGLLFGVKGNIRIREGGIGQEFALHPSGKMASLPFAIAVDKFTLKRYPTGQPKEFRSDVRLLRDGKEVLQGSIRVNHPLTLDGISLYQADYEVLGLKQVSLAVDRERGKTSELVLRPRETALLSGSQYKILLVSFDPGTTKRGAGVEIRVEEQGTEPKRIAVFQNDPHPAKLGNATLRFMGYEPLYSTGLQIGYDPGTNVVWIGCGLLIIGFCLTLFTNLCSVTVRLKAVDGGTRIEVSGRSRKDRAEFRERLHAAVEAGLKGT